MAAGPRASSLFTILARAKCHHLEPSLYIRDVIQWSYAGEADLEALLPDRWATANPEHVLQHRLDESRRKAAQARGSETESMREDEDIRLIVVAVVGADVDAE